MKRLFFIILLAFITACGGGGSGTDKDGNVITEDPITSFGGRIEKGPFQEGASIEAFELGSSLIQTGRTYQTNTINDTGAYLIEGSDLQGVLDLYATGYYFNENTNTVETSTLELSGLADSTEEGGNINIITHIIKLRVIELIKNQGKTFAEANTQAVSELYSYFDWTPENPLDTNISTSAKLLFLSAAICKDRNVSQVSALLSALKTDMEDGMVNISVLNSSFSSVDTAEVSANITSMYGSCPDIASVKAQVLTKLGLVDTTIKIITVQPVASAEFYIFTGSKSLYGFKNNTVESINIEYVQQYLGETNTYNAGINEFFSLGSGASKVLYFTITLPDSIIKSYSQNSLGVLTEETSLPSKPEPVSMFFNDGEFKAEENVGSTNITAIASGGEMQAGRLYGYYKTDHFIWGGVDKGRGAFLVHSTTGMNWLSANTYGSYMTNITSLGRMW